MKTSHKRSVRLLSPLAQDVQEYRLAEGRQPLYVARQLDHSLPVLFSTYAHLIDEYAEVSQPVDGEVEIAKVRSISWVSEVRHGAT